MNGVAATLTCSSCGAEISPGLLACPGCHRLAHAAELAVLAQQASAAQQAGDISQSLGFWRAALELLPPETNQFAVIQLQIEQLGRQLDTRGIPSPAPKSSTGPSWAGKAAAGAGFVGMLLWKLKVVVLLVATKGKLLLLGLTKTSTFLSMFASFAVYWTAWGWPFALGLVLSIYIHEMGHVDMLRRYGFKATAPMFIPGVGALIRLRQHPSNPSEDARIGLAGPLWGMGAALACYLIYLATGAAVWAAIAHLGAFINIFNLIPIGSLDGGRGFHALSRNQALLITVALGIAWFLSSEPMILLVAIVALYRSVTKAKDAQPDRVAFAMFLFLIASLSSLVCVRGGA
jgi:Zn-dependent protease